MRAVGHKHGRHPRTPERNVDLDQDAHSERQANIYLLLKRGRERRREGEKERRREGEKERRREGEKERR